jgi:hypothetical protein
MNRFVAVLNKKIETGRLMNALAHMSAGFSALYPNKEELLFKSYFDKEGGDHPSISDNPFIVLSSDNSNQIRTLRNVLKEKNILFNDFTNTMIVGTAEEQRERTKQTPELELEYYGICFFGEENELRELTKRFSLWR